MATALEITNKIWSRFARLVLGFSFRSLIVFATLIFCVFPGRLSFLTDFDRALLAGLSHATGIQVGPAEIGIVVVPDDRVRVWEADFYNAGDLSSLLSNILHSSSASVGLILDRPLVSQATELDQFLLDEHIINDSLQQVLEKKRYLNELLNDQRVVLGALSQPRDHIPVLKMNNTQAFGFELRKLRDWYQFCVYCRTEARTQNFDGDWFPVLREHALHDELWVSASGAYSSSFLGAFYLNEQALAVAAGEQAVTEWPNLFSSYLKSQDGLALPLQAFIPAYKTSQAFTPKIISLSLEEALLVNAFPRFVFIVPEKDLALAHDKAASLYSLNEQRTYSIAWWFEPIFRALILFFVIYLCFISYRIQSSNKRSVILISFYAGLILLAIFVALKFKLWFPVSSWIIYSMIALLFASLWFYKRKRTHKEHQLLANAIEQATYRLEDSKLYTEAMGLFAHHPETKYGIEKICRLANKMEDDNVPLEQVVSVVGTLLPVVNYDAKLNEKIELLKLTMAEKGELSDTATRDPEEFLSVPDSLGRYQIQKEIGRGAVGVVYLGFDPAISRPVAIKTLDARHFSRDQHENLQARFFREAEAAGRMNHPNIVSVFDVGEEGELAYIAMDYVEGIPLSDCIQASRLLPVPIVFRAIHDVAVALSYAHEHQIVHRDIKPGNIMFCDEPYTLKVADFGIARLLDNSKTSTGEILGSPLYMAPEQLRGSKVGPTADIFSLGVTFYQLLSGTLPFNADNLASLTYEIIHTKHKNIRSVRKDLPASATRIVNQCLQKDPEDRYESALELVGILRKAIRRDFPAEAKRWGMV